MSADIGNDSPPQRVTIDEDGDLTLVVGEDLKCPTKEFLVCSSTMRRASPVWKTMLFGGFQESKPAEGQWVVALPADNPDVLGKLLHLVHATVNADENPHSFSLTTLYELLTLMDKYDTLRFARPWKDPWLDTVKGVSHAENGPTLCMALYVALRMGAESTAFSIASHMSKHAKVHLGEVFGEGPPVRISVFGTTIYESVDSAGSHRVSEMIKKMRERRIRTILDITWRTVDTAMSGTGLFSPKGPPDFDFLGRLWVAQTEVRRDFLPKSPNFVSESPVDLTSSLSKIIQAMGPPLVGISRLASLKTALQHLDNASMRAFWNMDSELMRSRREVSGVTEQLSAVQVNSAVPGKGVATLTFR